MSLAQASTPIQFSPSSPRLSESVSLLLVGSQCGARAQGYAGFTALSMESRQILFTKPKGRSKRKFVDETGFVYVVNRARNHWRGMQSAFRMIERSRVLRFHELDNRDDEQVSSV